MGTTRFSNFFDQRTRRPTWANDVAVDWDEQEVERSLGDVRDLIKAAFDAGLDLEKALKVKVPTKVLGIVVPVRTGGRKTEDVAGRNLTGTVEQRGHILALSLGGPDVNLNVLPQPMFMNMLPRRSFARLQVHRLRWREFEEYAQYCAELGLAQMTAPGPDWLISRKRYSPKQRFYAAVPPNTPKDAIPPWRMLAAPTTRQYAKGSAPIPSFAVQFEAVMNYRRGNTPRSAAIALTVAGRNGPPSLLARYVAKYRESATFYQAIRRIQSAPLRRAAKREREEEIAANYHVKRRRQTRTPQTLGPSTSSFQ